MVRKLLSTHGPTGARAYVARALDGATHMLMHELDALEGHWAELRERLAVAREAGGLAELVSAQVDLLPETRARLALDQRERRALLHSLLADLRAEREAA
ncbi:MAG: hypothetical protein ACT4PK_00835 [Gammaproteobacteria bacterium]